ncbi:MAG: SMC-Scp complex subunit ScpB [Elusimicrobia bacterium RIFOXYD2_FULL_34_15]|nr:MAG: SMC-Scp complex subunit ScpB [Elusimicrobia bacterium RIFOXYD2_FULL_34_15]
MELKKIIEALLFVSQGPLKIETIAQILGDKSIEEVKQAIQELIKEYAERQSAIQIIEIAGGVQFSTKRDYAQYIRKLYKDETILKLSASALETLAIVAYKQPITRAEIEQIRGVEVSAVLKTLVEKNLVRPCGKKETVGTPFLYGTTQQFLVYFGLKSTDELPSLEEINVEQEQ